MPIAVPINVRAFITVMATPAVLLLRNNTGATVNDGLTPVLATLIIKKIMD